MGYRLELPGNKPELEFVVDYLLEHPLKGFEIKDPYLPNSLGRYANNLVEAGVLDILYNRKKKSTTLMIKTDQYHKKKGRGRSIEYVLGDKLNNVLTIPAPTIKMPKILL